MSPYTRISHSDYYRNRWSEEELRSDFPGDDILIEGLHAMQVYFYNNNVPVEIPVVKVMNTAHYLAAYMFQTTCSGDRIEYDMLAYCSVGHDKSLMAIAMVVLAAMLHRTEGARANHCRNLILEDRNEDFYDGITLYEQFLDSAEERFAEEDFLIDLPDVMEQIKEKDEIIQQQAQQIQQLQYTITAMEEKTNNTQINIYQGPVYQECSFTDSHDIINNYARPETQDDVPTTPKTSPLFTQKARTEGKEAEIIQALQRSFAGRTDKARALVAEIYYWQHNGYIDSNFNAKIMYDELEKLISMPFRYAGFRKYYNE